MSRPFQGYTIHEGFNQLEPIQLDITQIEVEFAGQADRISRPVSDAARVKLFKLGCNNGLEISPDYKAVFNVRVTDTEASEYTLYPGPEGYLRLTMPVLPITVLEKNDGLFSTKQIPLRINGEMADRQDECYFKVQRDPGQYLYTLIKDMVVYDGFLCIYDNNGHYYKLQPEIAIAPDTTALYISANGGLFACYIDTWEQIDTFLFYSITHPEALSSYSDGFYTAGAAAEPIENHLGEGHFADYTAYNARPENHFLNVTLKVYDKDPVPFHEQFLVVRPGNLDYIPISMACPLPPADTSPNLNEIEGLASITFSSEFKAFLTAKNLNQLKKLQKAGPISYLTGIPADSHMPVLQSHVDLYLINPDAIQNQKIIDKNYKTVFGIATTSRNRFLESLEGTGISLYQAAQIHELAVQGRKFLNLALAGTLSDYRMVNSPTPQIAGSSFASEAFANNINACGCSDCKSMVSPFAYMVDLIRYCAEHIDYQSYDHGAPDYDAFITLLTNKFLQPFGSIQVSCETLHDEYCRVRLVTEILEKVVAAASLDTVAQATLTNAKHNYLTTVYRALLQNAGTSQEELRDIVSIASLSKKEEATQKWADRIGLPLNVPGSATLTSDRLWLTFNASAPGQVLDATNLEDLFGFRNTGKSQTAATNKAQILDWRQEHLKTLWNTRDYLLSAYSREGATVSSTPKANWKPVIDPDIMGITDMVYSAFKFDSPVYKLWQNRKADTDSFLSYYHGAPGILARTSADITNRQIKVVGRNLLAQQIYTNKIELFNASSSRVTFDVYSKALSRTDSVLSLSGPSPAMFQPLAGSGVRYKRVLAVPVNKISTTLTTFTIDWNTDVIEDVLSGGFAKLESSGDPSVVYATTGGTSSLSVSYPAGNKKEVTVTLGSLASTAFAGGNVLFIYEVEANIFTDQVPDPEIVATTLLTRTETYTPLSPAFDTALSYIVWDTPNIAPWDTGISAYANLKKINAGLKNGTATEDYYTILADFLHMDPAAFNRMMELMEVCEAYLAFPFSSPRPTDQELYELASLFRNCGNYSLRAYWIEEELRYTPSVPGGTPVLLKLSGNYFWKPLTEPLQGAWDPARQTIPSSIPEIDDTHVPLLDPELVGKEEMLHYPASKIYLDLYDSRVVKLKQELDKFYGWQTTSGGDLFEDILNYVANNDKADPYDVSPYTTINLLYKAISSNDVFVQEEAAVVAWSEFRLSKEDFTAMMEVKSGYESPDPSQMPAAAQLDKGLRLLLSAYKRKQLYDVASTGWIQEEISGSFPNGTHVYYYNVFPMRMAPARASAADRSEWQQTLQAWNRQPFVNPDIIPPEYIKDFVTGNYGHDAWKDRKVSEDALFTLLRATFDPATAITYGVLRTRFEQQIELLIARDTGSSLTPIPGSLYLHYFTDIAVQEAKGEDIIPMLDQLGFSISEYRYLRKIYDLLLNANPSATASLFEGEYDDIANIMLRIRKRNLSFSYVLDEYNNQVILSDKYFILYEPSQIRFPENTLPVVNSWRFSLSEQKEWSDTLQGRMDRKAAVTETWKEAITTVEDECLPFLRNAYIAALQGPCETFNAAADRLAKSYFIETRDNCCVNHTRVSFAVETLQGFVFALQNGIFDEYLADFSLYAPYIEREWQWIGSYASWRSAVFAFIYPENLLYPTLKRKQSPKFMELAERLQGATRFSPENACAAAKEYTDYFNDVQDLEIVCTTSTHAQPVSTDATSCCDTAKMNTCSTTYFFAKAPSGYSYWSFKYTDDPGPESHSFWEQLNIPQNADMIGCYVFKDLNAKGVAISNSLWLFYTYYDNGKLTLAYSVKDVSKAATGWKDEKVNDLPTFTEKNDPLNEPYAPLYVMACQQSSDTRDPSFFIGYRSRLYGYYHCHALFVRQTKKLSPESFDTVVPIPPLGVEPKRTVYHNWEPKPVSAVNFRCNPNVGLPGGIYQMLALGFEGEVVFFAYGVTATYQSPIKVSHLTGLYELNGNSGQLMLLYYDYADSKHKGYIATVNYTENPNTISVSTVLVPEAQLSAELQTAYRIYPAFASDTDIDRVFAVGSNANAGGVLGAKLMLDQAVPALAGRETFMLVPDGGFRVEVSSAACIPDIKARKLAVEQHMKANTNSPLGNVASYFQCTSSQLEYLVEAYYFVPMLLALDQQQRGQYESALEWYRSIYDYTEELSVNRKIYYGLKLEEKIKNTYDHAAGWLLDPLNPHLIARTRANSHTKYVLLNIIQCIFGYADRQYTLDTVETVPQARKLYSAGLDLLKTPELQVKPNACVDISSACLSTGTVLNNDPMWSTMFDKLQGLLNSYGDPAVTQARVNYVLGIFNGGASMLSKFTAAFDYLYANPPAPGSSVPVVTVVNELPDKINDTYRYVLAFDNSAVFHQAVAANFQTSVANVSGVSRSTVAQAGAGGQLDWLKTPLQANTSPYSFGFAANDGSQKLSSRPFNPMAPELSAFEANLAYSNAPVFVNYASQNNLPVNYIPLLTYPFCLPVNPVFEGLQLRGNLELYKIFNCRNIAGMVRELDPYAAATDSTTGVPVIGAGGTLNVPGNTAYTPSQYRFRVLIERAKQLVGQSQQLESLFLAALEKLDAENYSQLQARQGLETAKATVRLQDLRINQAVNEKQVVTLQQQKAHFMVNHFYTLIQNGSNFWEKQSLRHLEKNIDYMNSALVFQGISAVLYGIQGLALISSASASASAAEMISNSFGALAAASSGVGGMLSTNASMESTRSQYASMQASFERRGEEWQFQADLATRDAAIANQQVAVADDNIRIVTQERQIADLNVTHAEETLNFLQNKFTNAALYGWMSGVLERSYSYMLNTSTAVARTAERQLYFERQEQAGPFILNDYWEAPSSGGPGSSTDRRGLTGSARLLSDIAKLEQHAFDSFKRKLQMTKVISLANNFPEEFQRFRETGVLNFQLTNKQFDYDYPGHYLRLINDVKTTVVGLVPVYDSIKATLTADTTSYTVIGGNTFQKSPIKRLEVDSVALTSTTLATGVFDMQPNSGEILHPFEGMGIESRWEFKLPPFSNRFDFSNIADVVVAVNYTALDSYLYRYQVLQELDNKLTFNKPVSFKNDFPDQWFELAEAEVSSTPFGVTFELTRDMFPQGVLDLKLNKGTDIVLYFARNDGYTKEVSICDLSVSTAQQNTNYSGGATVNGKFTATQLMNTIQSGPVMKLRLLFDNTVENRTMFKDGSIRDIILLIPCKAELRNYPL